MSVAAHFTHRPCLIALTRHDRRALKKPSVGFADHPVPQHRRGDSYFQRHGVRSVERRLPNRLDYITLHQRTGRRHGERARSARLSSRIDAVRGIKDSGLGYKEGVQEAMKSFTNIKTYSLPWV